ncbi:MAG: hypothetical protein IJ752_08640 [Alphaproteobacteria bacterium]|nr:hypothetical protein [Alphaproteobacteria bacterium]
MKNKSIALGVLLVFAGCFFVPQAKAQGRHDKLVQQYKAQEAKAILRKQENQSKSSIWDDDSEANPYFKKQKSNKAKSTDTKKKKGAKEPYRSTFKRRVYTGPSKDEIEKAAAQKAISNFKSFMASDDYNIKYEHISYDVAKDALSVNDFVVIPSQKSNQSAVPYLMKAKEIVLKDFNIGEKEGTPMLENGEMTVRKLEIPVWNDKAVKKGKVEATQLKMKGELPKYLKAKEGKLDIVDVRNFRSETIINETILNNIIRSKVFAASAANFVDVELKKNIFFSLMNQDLEGLTFSSAQIDKQLISTLEGAKAAMTSYSARILNTDLVLGARLEAEKQDPNFDIEQLKQNVAENKAAVAAADAEAAE